MKLLGFSTKVLFTTALLFGGAVLGVSQDGYAQTTTTPASGTVVNTYAKVTSISGSNINVDSAAGIAAGDRGLLIQMKGASVDRTDTATHGDILGYGSAGRFEYVEVTSVSGSTIVLENAPTVGFQISGLVQFVRVPVYNSQTLTGTISAAPWDGDKGGVIAIDDTGTLTLSGDIDASGHGFRGGALTQNGAYDSCASDQTNYTAAASIGTGNKGEGITLNNTSHAARRGHNANGGGGGNWTDAGGGGGSNYGFGGLGGRELDLCDNTGNFGGLGGEPLDYTPNTRVFLGGGAGSGSEVSQAPTGGDRSGGGIILLRANQINNSSGRLITNGLSAVIDTFNGSDGGAAAGVIGVSVRNGVTGIPIADAIGGDGGDENNTSYAHGTGGGGGGGALVLNGPLCSDFNYTLTGGEAGTSTLGTNVGDPNWGATDGGPGSCISGFTELPLIPLSTADYSDAPTTGTSYGDARHTITAGIQLGANIDADAGSLASTNADGDDTDGTNDEDGISAFPALAEGDTSYTIASGNISAVGSGTLHSWIDFNNNGVFEVSEYTSVTVTSGTLSGDMVWGSLPVLTAGTTFARFRYTSDATVTSSTPSGLASDGEVEDYQVTIDTAPPPSPICPVGYTLGSSSGYADTVIVSALNSTLALGMPELPSTTATNSNSARLNNSNNTLILDLTDLVPENAIIPMTIAKNNSAADYSIAVSDDNIGYTVVEPNYNTGTPDSLQPFDVTVPTGGARYIRFQRNSGSLWVGGIEYSDICTLATGSMSGAKSVTVWDPLTEGLYAVPGNDVIYSIEIVNDGDAAIDNDTVVVIDAMPSEIEFYNGDIDDGGPETNPVIGIDSGTGLTLNYASDVAYSDAATKPADFASCTYSPTAGYDPDVTFICFNPSGTMVAGDPDPSYQLQFRARIK